MATRSALLVAAGLCLIATGQHAAQAQFATKARSGQSAAPPNRSDPVGITADNIQYDSATGIVTLSGNVEAWQNDHVLRADKVTFDRNRDVAAASGHVWIMEPDGQVLFSDYAELTQGMRDGVLKHVEALLAENGKLIGNGARRTNGEINELSRAIYTTCNLCKKDPSKPPLWELRARSALQDKENKRVEYRDVAVDIYGVPVAWFPYFWHADPSVKRASGFLVPGIGNSSSLGSFFQLPYYWVLDDNSDATIVPMVNTKQYFNLDTQYRRRFNDGTLNVDLGFGYDQKELQGAIFANGAFDYNDTWRYGFNLNRASSAVYLRDYRFANQGDVLTSNGYLEGFGTGAYSRLDASAYQGLVASITQARLPYALPRYKYAYQGEPDALGGRFSFYTEDFNVLREQGTNDQRLAARLQWDRPFAGALGEQYKLTLQTDAAGYNATSLNDNPNFSNVDTAQTARAQPNVALEVRWPLVRDGWGQQIVEPIAQLVAGPYTSGFRNSKIPNEDSLDWNFTDQNLFSINKFPGLDRQEGGMRLNAGLHMRWTAGGMTLDQLVGESFRSHADDTFPIGSGLEHRRSDVVTRTTFTPARWFDIIGRTRLDRRDLSLRFADVQASGGIDAFRLGLGYLYSDYNPYNYYDQATIPSDFYTPRNEIVLSATGKYDQFRFTGYARRNLQLDKMDSLGLRATFENECLEVDASVAKRYTSLNGDTGSTLVLLQITFKTVGQFGFRAF